MCGRYVLVMGEDGIEELIREGDIPAELMERLLEEGRARIAGGSRPRRSSSSFARYNIAPTQDAPIVVSREGRRQLELARWSYIPGWWKEPEPPKFATFNARNDRLKSSGFWRAALDTHRCMVPASGFYEWKRSGKTRQPFYVHRKDGRLTAFAGLYSLRTDPETGDPSTTFTIITTPSNGLMSELHDRIPLVLGDTGDELWSVWLDPQTPFKDVERHVTAREWPDMTMHAVSTDVNATGAGRYVDEPRLIEPVEPEEQKGLF